MTDIAELGKSLEWQPIQIAIAAAKEKGGWISPCLFGKLRTWGWAAWVGQCDDGDIWLARDEHGECWDCDKPTHFAPLPAPPITRIAPSGAKPGEVK